MGFRGCASDGRGWVFGRLRSERPARVGFRAYTQRVTGEGRFRGVSSERAVGEGRFSGVCE